MLAKVGNDQGLGRFVEPYRFIAERDSIEKDLIEVLASTRFRYRLQLSHAFKIWPFRGKPGRSEKLGLRKCREPVGQE